MNKNILKGKNTQSKVFNFICEYYNMHSYMPSYEEIMTGTGIKSKCTVKTHIDRLYDEGWIESENRGQARAYRIGKRRRINNDRSIHNRNNLFYTDHPCVDKQRQ